MSKLEMLFHLHGVINKNLQHIVEELDVGDFVAFTYFPVDLLNEINKNPEEAREDLEKIFEIVPNKMWQFLKLVGVLTDFVGGNYANSTRIL